MSVIEFRAWPKTPRLLTSVIVTEKIDGTNAAVVVTPAGEAFAQSRKRIITPGDDNFGFACWVETHAGALAELLGEGYHFGEWWGSGIQRGYGLAKGEKRFSLFNVSRWGHLADEPSTVPGLGVVPTLLELEEFDTTAVQAAWRALQGSGSLASPGFMNPEGVVAFHAGAGQVFKLTDRADQPKWMTETQVKA